MAWFRNPFSFIFTRSSGEDRVAAYVIREHERGRSLNEILEDNVRHEPVHARAAGAAARQART